MKPVDLLLTPWSSELPVWGYHQTKVRVMLVYSKVNNTQAKILHPPGAT